MSNIKSDRSTVNRSPTRGHYDISDLYKVLDSSFVCQVSFIHENWPLVIPTAYGRDDKYLYLHGATSSRMIRVLENGDPCTISVTLLDGLVLARSVFHHSMNYRSAVIFGTAEKVGEEQKEAALKLITDHILKGRWDESRLPNSKEMKATTVLRIPLSEGSVKIRKGPPKDEEEDYSLNIWAGIVPINTSYGRPEPDPELHSDIEIPNSIKNIGHGRHHK